MRMRKHNLMISSVFLTLVLAAGLTGCSNPFVETGEVHEEEDYSIQILSKDELKDGFFYIKHGEDFYEIPYGEDSFDGNDEKEQDYILYNDADELQGDPSRTVFYTKDKSELQIPTMYQDDQLVFKTKETVSDSFEWERFLDGGYTAGVRNIGINDVGLICLTNYFDNISENSPFQDILGRIEDTDNASGDNMESELYSSMQGEDSGEVSSATYNSYILDSVSSCADDGSLLYEHKIEESDISESGTVLFGREIFESDKELTYNFYKGTRLFQVKASADRRYFYNFENYYTSGVTFSEDGYAVLNVPVFFKSGYYKTNMSGIFRYISQPYSETIDIYNESYNKAYYQLDEEGKQIIMDESGNFVYEPDYQGEEPGN